MKNLFFIILFSSLIITTNAQETQPVTSKKEITDKESEQPRIAVVSLRIIKNGNQYSFSLPNSIIVNASKKNVAEKKSKRNENDFICFVLDEHKKIIDTLVIEHPLKTRYEYPNGDGTIGSTTVELIENEVLLRFTYSLQMKYLLVSKVGENSKLKTLTTLILPNAK